MRWSNLVCTYLCFYLLECDEAAPSLRISLEFLFMGLSALFKWRRMDVLFVSTGFFC